MGMEELVVSLRRQSKHFSGTARADDSQESASRRRGPDDKEVEGSGTSELQLLLKDTDAKLETISEALVEDVSDSLSRQSSPQSMEHLDACEETPIKGRAVGFSDTSTAEP